MCAFPYTLPSCFDSLAFLAPSLPPCTPCLSCPSPYLLALSPCTLQFITTVSTMSRPVTPVFLQDTSPIRTSTGEITHIQLTFIQAKLKPTPEWLLCLWQPLIWPPRTKHTCTNFDTFTSTDEQWISAENHSRMFKFKYVKLRDVRDTHV